MSFTTEVGGFVSRSDARIADVIRKAELQMLSEVVLGTPVDTGRARGNWQFSEGRPATGELNTFDKTGLGTMANAATEIAAAKVGGPDWFLSNNVPYILMLEFGHSKQAPAGFARIAAARFGQNVERAAQALAA